jgi:hypothetical protein
MTNATVMNAGVKDASSCTIIAVQSLRSSEGDSDGHTTRGCCYTQLTKMIQLRNCGETDQNYCTLASPKKRIAKSSNVPMLQSVSHILSDVSQSMLILVAAHFSFHIIKRLLNHKYELLFVRSE